ncbi:hypothetical protein B0H10DRAFT_8505 [Mycena sp. CBHHK59/15]|nr:hypothetical protein B0H10DRAFT_8505 [Mycena sp. CBHHK59/15]
MMWPSSKLNYLLAVLTVISTALNVSLLPKVIRSSQEIKSSLAHDIEYPYDLREIPGHFRTTAMTFQVPDSAYPLTDDHTWGSLVPPQSGFVQLGPEGTSFSVSLFHQLHCINGVRFAYVAARDGILKTPEARSAAFGHVNHCFHVLRNSLLCKADTTLVPVDSPNRNTIRRCRDWTQVREFVDSNQEFWRGVPFNMPSDNETSEGQRE